jgi:hypothetical protein
VFGDLLPCCTDGRSKALRSSALGRAVGTQGLGPSLYPPYMQRLSSDASWGAHGLMSSPGSGLRHHTADCCSTIR